MKRLVIMAIFALLTLACLASDERVSMLLRIANFGTSGSPPVPNIPIGAVWWHRPGAIGTSANQAGSSAFDGTAWGFSPTEGVGYQGALNVQTNVVLVGGGWQSGYRTNGVTVAGWVYLYTNRPALRYLFSEYIENGQAAFRNGFLASFNYSHRLEFYITYNNGAAFRGRSTPNNLISTGGWHHVSFVWQYTGNLTNYMDYTISLDAVRVDNANFGAGTPTNFPVLTNYFQLGSGDLTVSGLGPFTGGVEGNLDEWVMYNRALTPAEITNLYTETRGSK